MSDHEPIVRSFMDPNNPRGDVYAYDLLAEQHGITVGLVGWLPKAAEAIGYARPFGPSREPSPNCKSGKHNYCTCDTCF